MNGRYVLRGREPVRCEDLQEWAEWFEDSDQQRIVARTYLGDARLVIVCTDFLGLDYNHDPEGAPLLFETMVRDERPERAHWWAEQWRYSTWQQAEEGHQRAVGQVVERLPHQGAPDES